MHGFNCRAFFYFTIAYDSICRALGVFLFVMNILEQLNEQQLNAAHITEGNLRVIAGAGSGKTKLLVGRYAFLVRECGIDAANILCVTFTNKAAGEMKKRIRAAIGEGYDTSLICTYHGFCARLLRDDMDKFLLPKKFQIIDVSQQKSILESIYEKRGLKMDFATFERILHCITKAKQTMDYVPRMCSRQPIQIMEAIETQEDEIVEEFMQLQKESFSLDFHDLINFAVYLLETNEDVREKWQDRLNYIQVDEFQDSSHKEMRLIDILSEKYRNLMIVGDPDQNIYEWRGSDVKLLVDFDKIHAATKTVFLNRNYRSTPQILNCANTLIAKNHYRLEKDLYTENPNGNLVYHYHEKNDFAVADRIVGLIKKIHTENNWPYSYFTVLYRSSFLSRVVEDKLAENVIPYEILGGVKFFHRMEVQDIVAYLKLIVFDDDSSFKRIVNKPKRQFSRLKMQKLMACQKHGESLFKTLCHMYPQTSLMVNPISSDGSEGNTIYDFIHHVEDIREQVPNLAIHELVQRICDAFGYEQYIRELGDMERLDNLAEFKRIAGEYERNFGDKLSAEDFLNQISLQYNDEDSPDTDAVKMMTIHAAKGLEFPCVFLIGMTEGVFPSSKTIEERKELGLEEERRLCYVAITRAEKRLFLFDADGTSPKGIQNNPSRFLLEIGEENVVREGNLPADFLHGSAAALKNVLDSENSDECDQLQLDTLQSIEHPIFGRGTIVGKNPRTGAFKVKFDKLERERDIAGSFFASLRKVEKDPVSNEASERENGFSQNGLWSDSSIPQTGWTCVGMTDLGKGHYTTCEMCKSTTIRYVHHMQHPNYPHTLGVGCVCAGRMEGNVERAKTREANFKGRAQQKKHFLSKKWKQSSRGNEYAKLKDHVIVVFQLNKGANAAPLYSFSVDQVLSKAVCKTLAEAKARAFDFVIGMR